MSNWATGKLCQCCDKLINDQRLPLSRDWGTGVAGAAVCGTCRDMGDDYVIANVSWNRKKPDIFTEGLPGFEILDAKELDRVTGATCEGCGCISSGILTFHKFGCPAVIREAADTIPAPAPLGLKCDIPPDAVVIDLVKSKGHAEEPQPTLADFRKLATDYMEPRLPPGYSLSFDAISRPALDTHAHLFVMWVLDEDGAEVTTHELWPDEVDEDIGEQMETVTSIVNEHYIARQRETGYRPPRRRVSL